MADELLRIENLDIVFDRQDGPAAATRGVCLTLDEGRVLGLVGESGCGKSVTAAAVLGLLPHGGRVAGGRILFRGRDTAAFSEKNWQALRGGRAAMIFQDPDACLDPYYTVGAQLVEALHIHRRDLSRAECRRRAAALFRAVGLPAERLDAWPHQLSGGQRQRVMAAMALITDPALLIADEPTTALDVTIQAQIMELLADIRTRTGMGILFITHDLGLAAELCDAIAVVYAGRVVERGSAEDIFCRTAHPYTAGLLNARPRGDGRRLIPIPGAPAEASAWSEGCPFAPRCPRCREICRTVTPEERALGPGHTVACHAPLCIKSQIYK